MQALRAAVSEDPFRAQEIAIRDSAGGFRPRANSVGPGCLADLNLAAPNDDIIRHRQHVLARREVAERESPGRATRCRDGRIDGPRMCGNRDAR
jgi:hypothetical protein